MKKALLVILAILLVGAGGYFYGKSNTTVTKNYTPSVEEKEEDTFIQTEVTISAETIQEGMNDIGQLVTQEYTYTEVSSISRDKVTTVFGKEVKIPGATSTCIYSYDGVIKAGVDFSEISVSKNDEEKAILIEMPEAKIISNELIEDSFKLYDEKNSIFNPWSVEDYHISNAQIKDTALDRAQKNGILKKATDNACVLIQGFLQSGYELSDYQIIIQQKK